MDEYDDDEFQRITKQLEALGRFTGRLEFDNFAPNFMEHRQWRLRPGKIGAASARRVPHCCMMVSAFNSSFLEATKR